jgi:hypothetical protein
VCLAPQQLRSLALSDITLTDGRRATVAVELGRATISTAEPQTRRKCFRSDDLPAVNMWIVVFWFVTPCSLAGY